MEHDFPIRLSPAAGILGLLYLRDETTERVQVRERVRRHPAPRLSTRRYLWGLWFVRSCRPRRSSFSSFIGTVSIYTNDLEYPLGSTWKSNDRRNANSPAAEALRPPFYADPPSRFLASSPNLLRLAGSASYIMSIIASRPVISSPINPDPVDTKQGVVGLWPLDAILSLPFPHRKRYTRPSCLFSPSHRHRYLYCSY